MGGIARNKGFLIALAIAAWLGLEVGGKGTGVVTWLLSPSPPAEGRNVRLGNVECEVIKQPVVRQAELDRRELVPPAEKAEAEAKITEYTEAIQENRDDADAYFRRGAVRYKSGDLKGAIVDWSEAIRLNPQNAKFFWVRGWAFRARRDFDRAIADQSTAIGLQPENVHENYIERGNAYYEQREYD